MISTTNKKKSSGQLRSYCCMDEYISLDVSPNVFECDSTFHLTKKKNMKNVACRMYSRAMRVEFTLWTLGIERPK